MTQISFSVVFLYIILSFAGCLLVSKEHRWKALLAGGVAALVTISPASVLMLVLLSMVTYVSAKKIAQKPSLFEWTIPVYIIVLAAFKLAAPLIDHFEVDEQQMPHAPDSLRRSFLQIIGISYFTFNAIGYLFDVKRKITKPELNYFRVLLYLLYFPALFSGPLHRPNYLFRQFDQVDITGESITKGSRLILWGLFKNLVVAQRIKSFMLQLQHEQISGLYTLVTGTLFILYLYCNFSSFVDFFRGVSALFNVKLKHNFRNRVYFAYSRHEFWKGWHMSLNEWFRDYFFYPQVKKERWRSRQLSLLLITFTLIGLWHELSIKMMLWGTINGLWMIAEKKLGFQEIFTNRWRKLLGVVYHLSTSSILACIFLFPTLTALWNDLSGTMYFPWKVFREHGSGTAITLVIFLLMDQVNRLAKDRNMDDYMGEMHVGVRRLTYAGLTGLIILFALISEGIDNYYVQF